MKDIKVLAKGTFFTVTPESYSRKARRKAAWESAGSFLSQARTHPLRAAELRCLFRR